MKICWTNEVRNKKTNSKRCNNIFIISLEQNCQSWTFSSNHIVTNFICNLQTFQCQRFFVVFIVEQIFVYIIQYSLEHHEMQSSVTKAFLALHVANKRAISKKDDTIDMNLWLKCLNLALEVIKNRKSEKSDFEDKKLTKSFDVTFSSKFIQTLSLNQKVFSNRNLHSFCPFV